MKVLLIDVGSSFVKYTVCEDDGREKLLSGKIPFPEPLARSHLLYAGGKLKKQLRP